ncbi:MAG: antitoxin [Kiritimatiellae bacterium]|nr:antitoxin [Kiritimatiellia bacterium]
MELTKSFITDEEGSIKSVVIDFDTFKKLESLFLDEGLSQAMSDIQDEDEIDLETAKVFLKHHAG